MCTKICLGYIIVWVLWRNRASKIEIYYKEVPYVIMEAEISKICSPQAGDPGADGNGIVPV